MYNIDDQDRLHIDNGVIMLIDYGARLGNIPRDRVDHRFMDVSDNAARHYNVFVGKDNVFLYKGNFIWTNDSFWINVAKPHAMQGGYFLFMNRVTRAPIKRDVFDLDASKGVLTSNNFLELVRSDLSVLLETDFPNTTIKVEFVLWGLASVEITSKLPKIPTKRMYVLWNGGFN